LIAIGTRIGTTMGDDKDRDYDPSRSTSLLPPSSKRESRPRERLPVLVSTAGAEEFYLKHDRSGKVYGPYTTDVGAKVPIGKTSFTVVKKKSTAVKEASGPAIQSLITAARDKTQQWGKREAAVYQIKKTKNKQAVPALMQILRDEDEVQAVKQASISAIESIGDYRAIPALIHMLKGKAPSLKNLSAQTLTRMTKAPFFSEDAKKWETWWKKNSKDYVPLADKKTK
jgi:hypothetical protein